MLRGKCFVFPSHFWQYLFHIKTHICSPAKRKVAWVEHNHFTGLAIDTEKLLILNLCTHIYVERCDTTFKTTNTAFINTAKCCRRLGARVVTWLKLLTFSWHLKANHIFNNLSFNDNTSVLLRQWYKQIKKPESSGGVFLCFSLLVCFFFFFNLNRVVLVSFK